jgi:AcrR family transcriptional regulator
MRRQVPARLLAAAGELFSAQGYHGTSMREIADKARVLVGSIYNHFDDKEAIFRAVLRNQRPFGQALDAIADAEGQSAEDLLRDAGKRLTATFDSNPGLLNLLFIDMVEFDGKHLLELYDDE